MIFCSGPPLIDPVQDTGCGIPEAAQRKLFKPFVQVNILYGGIAASSQLNRQIIRRQGDSVVQGSGYGISVSRINDLDLTNALSSICKQVCSSRLSYLRYLSFISVGRSNARNHQAH